MIGKTVSHYRIVEKLGVGGMGVVYKAQDLKLDRPVALKFLPHHMGQWEEETERLAHERFVQEAKAASALDHPNIANIHEIDETEDGQTFIVMSYYEGETLKKKMAPGPLPVKEAVELILQIAEGLAKAHEHGIIHRDIKPANIMITTDGVAKVIDFGLAKLGDATRITKRGAAVGTVAYMSPEQAKGEDIDQRTDIWSLGAVLYEMLTGAIPFRGPSEAAVIQSILNESPKPTRELRKDAPEELGQIVARSLQKNRKARYASIQEVIRELTDLQIRWTPRPDAPAATERWRQTIRRPAIIIPAIFVILALGFLGWRYLEYQDNIRWAREEALPEIYKLVEEGDYSTAFDLARRAEPYLEDDPMLAEAWPEFSQEISIETSPPGAVVYFKDYGNPDGEWEALGTTPLDNVRIPIGFFRWKVEIEGFETVFPYAVTARLEPLQIEDFFIDRYEVTNRQFKAFADAGGYQDPKYWKQEFAKNGRVLPWQEAMEMFRDKTGRPGPSTWELGSYPEGQEDFPVGGVSWYEAAAYAEFAGKSLPTLYHWLRASDPGSGAYIIPSSNFSSDDPAPVGSYPGMGPYGTYDLAGNVEEWCWNETENKRYIMGGSFQNPGYMFAIPQIQPPWDRSASNGFRCIQSSEIRAEAMSPIPLASRDYSKETPVSDETFEIYRRTYAYDKKTDLHPKIESREESKYWTKEKISLNAAYGDERMTAYLFLPDNTSPPYQTVVYFPGASAVSLRSSKNLRHMNTITFLVRSGRALLYPIYKSTYERGDGFNFFEKFPSQFEYREHVIFWFKDLARSIDYLETRQDMDTEKLAFYGTSWGAEMGPLCIALEKRIKVGVLANGGFYPFQEFRNIPEVDQINFAPRVTVPVLMLNGRYDSLTPVESRQLPMFRFLGTPDEHKRHILYDTGHFPPRNEQIKETLDWLDRYLGPVQIGDIPRTNW
jgi:formylglycine-generating enzyme required for sulfatase activity/tRNA A-37 threonylcarbamoyl transferase component Bud32/cephalosporin-C deacetylase-like acetyl esterase